jgi:hypothetical protein
MVSGRDKPWQTEQTRHQPIGGRHAAPPGLYTFRAGKLHRAVHRDTSTWSCPTPSILAAGLVDLASAAQETLLAIVQSTSTLLCCMSSQPPN